MGNVQPLIYSIPTPLSDAAGFYQLIVEPPLYLIAVDGVYVLYLDSTGEYAQMSETEQLEFARQKVAAAKSSGKVNQIARPGGQPAPVLEGGRCAIQRKSTGALAHQFNLMFTKADRRMTLILADISGQAPTTDADYIRLANVIPADGRPKSNQWIVAQETTGQTKQVVHVQTNGDLWIATPNKDGVPKPWAAETQYRGGRLSLTWDTA